MSLPNDEEVQMQRESRLILSAHSNGVREGYRRAAELLIQAAPREIELVKQLLDLSTHNANVL